jgi:methyl coenzyme M reductase subunit D
VLGIVASPLSLLPVGRTGAIRLDVIVELSEGDAIVVVVLEEDWPDVMHEVELPHDAPFWQHPPPREAAQVCQFVEQDVTVTMGRVVVTVEVPAMETPESLISTRLPKDYQCTHSQFRRNQSSVCSSLRWSFQDNSCSQH